MYTLRNGGEEATQDSCRHEAVESRGTCVPSCSPECCQSKLEQQR